MGAGLLVFWCEKCKKRVCEAIPKATVWCACGRRAKPVGEGEVKENSGQPFRRKSGNKVNDGGQVGLPLQFLLAKSEL